MPKKKRPLQAENGLWKFPSPDNKAFQLVVPEKLLDDYSVFKRRAWEVLSNVNKPNPFEQSRCVYCWVA